MSSDDYIGIVKRRGFYYGFWLCASCAAPKLKELDYKKPRFKVKTIEEAILKGQSEQTEYGISFLNIKGDSS